MPSFIENLGNSKVSIFYEKKIETVVVEFEIYLKFFSISIFVYFNLVPQVDSDI